MNPVKRVTSKKTKTKKKILSPRIHWAFHLEDFWVVGVGRRFQGKDGCLTAVRKERLEFRKAE